MTCLLFADDLKYIELLHHTVNVYFHSRILTVHMTGIRLILCRLTLIKYDYFFRQGNELVKLSAYS
jgi:hypothetical protein